MFYEDKSTSPIDNWNNNGSAKNFAKNFLENKGVDVINSMTSDEEGHFMTVTLNDDKSEELDRYGELKYKVYEIFKSVIKAERVNTGEDYPGCIIGNENGDTIAENGLMSGFKYKGL